MWELDIGASIVDRGVVRFRIWAPLAKSVSVRVTSRRDEKEIMLQRGQWDYFEGVTENVGEGERYFYLLDGETARPDPASRFQPGGVHGPSQIVNPHAFAWDDDDWRGIPLKDFIIYELHVGAFTESGTFEAIIDHLDYLKDLGITVVELMPVSQFPGERNWGYDGVYPFAPQNSYGGPAGLKGLINACHKKGLGVILDVVYNHLGPEGNYLADFGPYFTDTYKTPWGAAINYDGPYSDEVRHYFVSNALYWITEYHVDALRIDAIQGIFDFGAGHFL
ncbi:MAG TPA: alpha-amylase family glycosyl hydrolase, partial [Syntrophales bacterium]|nr:alpha-amylase family glycosyl hydrolase [Syntrophales bacterium]